MNLEIHTAAEGSRLEIIMEGSLNTKTADELEAKLAEEATDATDIVLDIGGLQYISSAGLRVLLRLQNQMDDAGGALTVRHTSSEVMEIFDMTGLSSILTLE